MLPNTDFNIDGHFKERRIRKFALIVVDCFHKEYIYIIEFNWLISSSTSSFVPIFVLNQIICNCQIVTNNIKMLLKWIWNQHRFLSLYVNFNSYTNVKKVFFIKGGHLYVCCGETFAEQTMRFSFDVRKKICNIFI